ncbi:MAG: BON domain-containing protein [Rubrivivax sp.]|nr:BON domain-containing protein [Rubrivivax sp.]
MRRLASALLLSTLAVAGRICPAAEALENWFNDPFVPLSHAVAGCPEPKGPRMSAADRLSQSHHRAERGTTCWLRGECERPNAYEYDASIAEQLAAAWKRHPELQQSSIWLTVQGRIVFLDGCASRPGFAQDAERLARSVPRVALAVARVAASTAGRLPYPPLNAASASAR